MTLDAQLVLASGVLERQEVGQPVVAFEPDEPTGGESCRDPAGRRQALAGEAVDERFLLKLSVFFGGPRGCSHLLALSPGLLQCLSALPARMLGPGVHSGRTGAGTTAESGIGPVLDSCYMWRREGALAQRLGGPPADGGGKPGAG